MKIVSIEVISQSHIDLAKGELVTFSVGEEHWRVGLEREGHWRIGLEREGHW